MPGPAVVGTRAAKPVCAAFYAELVPNLRPDLACAASQDTHSLFHARSAADIAVRSKPWIAAPGCATSSDLR